MVIDFLVHGKHVNGYAFIVPIRMCGPRSMDFDERLRQIIEMNDEIETWEVDERRVRPILSLFYRHEAHSKLQFIFYGDGPDCPADAAENKEGSQEHRSGADVQPSSPKG